MALKVGGQWRKEEESRGCVGYKKKGGKDPEKAW